MNNRTFYFNLFALLAWFIFAGCSEDEEYADVDGQIPVIRLTAEHVKTEAGREFLIGGTVEDKDGINSIQLENADLALDKSIDLLTLYEELQYSYELRYKFKTARDFTGDNLNIKITVTDIGNRSTEANLLVTMDGDFTAPVFKAAPDNAITVLIKSETKLNLKFTAEDDKALDYVTISIPELNYDKKITANGKIVDFSDAIVLPAKPATYNLTLEAIDKFGFKTSRNCAITVSEMPDFQTMYLADVATAAELNSDVFGVPMRIERTDAYQYKANYYCEKAGTEIYFIPQKTDFYPICFGLDPENHTKLTDDPDLAKPIVLEQANVYYEITFDIKNSTYHISTYSIEKAIDPIPHVFGSISLDTWNDGGSWLQEFYFGYMTGGPTEVKRFTQDKTNPHLFYLAEPLSLGAGTKMNFVIHNWHSNGWWNYCTWRVDDSDEPEIFGYFGKEAKYTNPAWTKPDHVEDKWAKPTVSITGDYKLIFDAHLERAKLIPVNK